MQLFFKEHFQLIVFQKLRDWRLEKFCMKNHTYFLDLHQRSHWDTITIGPEGMINWILQLNNSQSGNSFNSLFDKHHVLNSPNQHQSKPRSICDRSGKPEDTERVFVDKGKTSRSHEIDNKRLHKELGSSDRSGKPGKLSENIRVKHTHDGTRELVESSSSNAHTVKEQVAPEENRDIASFNADNEFNRAIGEENIDFNIPGLPHSAVKRSHDINVQNLIQKVEIHPQRQALQSDYRQHRPFNFFSKKSQDVIIKQLETLNCANYSMLSQKHNAKHAWRIGTLTLSTARAVTSYEMIRQRTRDDTTENKKYIKSVLDLFTIPNFTSGRTDHTVTDTERKNVIKNTTLQINSKKSVRNDNSLAFTICLFVIHGSEKSCRNWVALKKCSARWTNLRTRATPTLLQKKKRNVYRSNWWIRSNFVGSDTMLARHRADFKEALSTLRRLKNAEDQA